MNGIVYKAQNKINGKIYVGSTTQGLDTRRYQHLHTRETSFGKAILKYGYINFEWTIIEHTSIDKLNKRENYWIKYYNSLSEKNGYNVRQAPNRKKEGLISFDEDEELSSFSNKSVWKSIWNIAIHEKIKSIDWE